MIGMLFSMIQFSYANVKAKNNETALLKEEVALLHQKIKDLEQRLEQYQQTSNSDASYSIDIFDMMRPSLIDQWMNTRLMDRRIDPMMFKLDYDVKETDQAYIFSFDIPGMDRSKINVEVKDNMVFVSGERTHEQIDEQHHFYRQQRSFGSFSKSFELPKNAKADTVSAKYENGVLIVTIEKIKQEKKKEDQSRKIDIK